MAEEIERLNYYQLQFLGADDFKAEQLYHRDMRRRHNLGPHTWGIVTGLSVDEVLPPGTTTDYDVFVQPGYAVDGFGREIVVPSQYKLTAADLQFTRPSTKGSSYSVYLAFAEEEASPAAFGYGACDGGEQNDRVRELYRIVIEPAPPLHAPVVIDGRDAPGLPSDESFPHQELPDSASTRWLVPLGRVTWNGTVLRVDAAGTQLRVYAKLVTAEVLGTNGRLVLRPRIPIPPDPPPAEEPAFAEVQGQLQVEGTIIAKKDVRLFGTSAVFENGAGANDTVPLWISRATGSDKEHDLHVEIGSKVGAADARLTVGPNGTDVLAVSADDKVHIREGKLQFGAKKHRQMITVEGDKYGIGTEPDTLFSRSDSAFVWYRGSTQAMTLDKTSRLTVPGGIDTSSLRVSGDVQIANDANVEGSLRLLMKGGGNDNDELAITRHHKGTTEFNDLRVIIGDDLDDNDAFTIGPVHWSDQQYRENFRVGNSGNVRAAGTLTIDGKTTLKDDVTLQKALKVTGTLDADGAFHANGAFTASGSLSANGGLSVTGNTQLQTLAVSGKANFADDLILAPGKAVQCGTGRFPIDVVAGQITFPTVTATVTSHLPNITGAVVHVALAAISGQGLSNQWSVTVASQSIVAPNKVTFTVQYTVAGNAQIGAVSYLVVFIP